ncbi:MAG: DUF4258 domain-containing protein [Megasphaera sp.]|uniref:DUF4258 domain-containing protein n=1 Tax=Megasphaera sp. TaxID=2023260 RepID=UPI003EFF9D7C
MINIDTLRTYYTIDAVFTTQHSTRRFRERGIQMRDIKNALFTGTIIEQYEDDFPFPSCLICGLSLKGIPLHVVMSDEGGASRIITAYFPDHKNWDETYTMRKKG